MQPNSPPDPLQNRLQTIQSTVDSLVVTSAKDGQAVVRVSAGTADLKQSLGRLKSSMDLGSQAINSTVEVLEKKTEHAFQLLHKVQEQIHQTELQHMNNFLQFTQNVEKSMDKNQKAALALIESKAHQTMEFLQAQLELQNGALNEQKSALNTLEASVDKLGLETESEHRLLGERIDLGDRNTTLRFESVQEQLETLFLRMSASLTELDAQGIQLGLCKQEIAENASLGLSNQQMLRQLDQAQRADAQKLSEQIHSQTAEIELMQRQLHRISQDVPEEPEDPAQTVASISELETLLESLKAQDGMERMYAFATLSGCQRSMDLIEELLNQQISGPIAPERVLLSPNARQPLKAKRARQEEFLASRLGLTPKQVEEIKKMLVPGQARPQAQNPRVQQLRDAIRASQLYAEIAELKQTIRAQEEAMHGTLEAMKEEMMETTELLIQKAFQGDSGELVNHSNMNFEKLTDDINQATLDMETSHDQPLRTATISVSKIYTDEPFEKFNPQDGADILNKFSGKPLEIAEADTNESSDQYSQLRTQLTRDNPRRAGMQKNSSFTQLMKGSRFKQEVRKEVQEALQQEIVPRIEEIETNQKNTIQRLSGIEDRLAAIEQMLEAQSGKTANNSSRRPPSQYRMSHQQGKRQSDAVEQSGSQSGHNQVVSLPMASPKQNVTLRSPSGMIISYRQTVGKQ